MGRSRDVPLYLKAIALAYRYDLGLTIAEIAERLSIHKNTLQTLFTRTRRRAQSSELADLLRHLENDSSRGLQPRIPPGSAAAAAAREAH